jgi:hypothetical protein
VRKVEQQPYELTETGWGEFDIGVVVSNTPSSSSRHAAAGHAAAHSHYQASNSLWWVVAEGIAVYVRLQFKLDARTIQTSFACPV